MKWTRKKRRGNPTVSAFVQLVERRVAPALATFGFKHEDSDIAELCATCFYGNGTRYVKLSVNVDPRDAPSYCNAVLGDGERTMPESDWNSAALWRLANAHPTNPADLSEYPLDDFADIRELVERMRADLEVHARDFLSGDLHLFQMLRAGVNQQREPYKIHSPVGDGTYKTEIDPVSAALKVRFS